MTQKVAFVGPLPPPVHGFSNICFKMLELLSAKSWVQVFDRSPRTLLAMVTQPLKPLRFFACCIRHKNVSLYLALSGGLGQTVDMLYVMISKLFNARLFVHHHSFAYVNETTFLNRMFFAQARKGTHIVLSSNMGTALVNAYNLSTEDVRVVSNAAFYDSVDPHVKFTAPDSPVRLGFLSNITFEKGFEDFFRVLTNLRQRKIVYRAFVAGPVSANASSTFEGLMRTAIDTTYLGPLYGLNKDEFYDALDVFLFPTKYVNEAEPLVIYEAIRSGVYVMACDRGAIAEMLRDEAGSVFKECDFVESATLRIEQLSQNRIQMQEARRKSFQRSLSLDHCAKTALANLVHQITGQ